MTQRDCVIVRASVPDAAFACAHGLIRKPLQPQNPREGDPGRHARIDHKALDVRTPVNSFVFGKRALEMAPRCGQIAKMILRDTDHLVAGQPIFRVGPALGQCLEFLRQRQGNAMPAVHGVKAPQAPEPIAIVLLRRRELGNFERSRSGGIGLRAVVPLV